MNDDRIADNVQEGSTEMFWDQVAGIYDVYVNVIDRKTHLKLKQIVSQMIGSNDDVSITVAEGRIPCAVAVMTKDSGRNI